MTRRRRLRRRLLWAGVLLGLVLLLAVVSLLRAGAWVGRRRSNLMPIGKEYAMRTRTALVVIMISMTAATVGAGATLAGAPEQWRTALQLRSDALNRQHGLEDSRTPEAAGEPALLEALMVRSEALNRRHGLGSHARKPAAAEQASWLEALMVRSDALNRRHALGAYAPVS